LVFLSAGVIRLLQPARYPMGTSSPRTLKFPGNYSPAPSYPNSEGLLAKQSRTAALQQVRTSVVSIGGGQVILLVNNLTASSGQWL
jgi:hypothetical protein